MHKAVMEQQYQSFGVVFVPMKSLSSFFHSLPTPEEISVCLAAKCSTMFTS